MQVVQKELQRDRAQRSRWDWAPQARPRCWSGRLPFAEPLLGTLEPHTPSSELRRRARS